MTVEEEKVWQFGEPDIRSYRVKKQKLWECDLRQWFSNLSWEPPTTAYFVCLSHLTHLIQLISSIVESARLELGVDYEGDIKCVVVGGPQDSFENHWSQFKISKPKKMCNCFLSKIKIINTDFD